jgi:hypothetical protein
LKKKLIHLKLGLLALLVAILFPPIFAPLIHNNESQRSAIRDAIYKDGHPYQSFFAILIKENYKDEDFGQRYNVYWFNYDSPTGDTATICYSKEIQSGKYEISCGTGP